jgi:hypothetical protein
MPDRPTLTPDLLRAMNRNTHRQFAAARASRIEQRHSLRAERKRKAIEGAAIVRKAPAPRTTTGPHPRHLASLAWAKRMADKLKLDWHTVWTKVVSGRGHLAYMFARDHA